MLGFGLFLIWRVLLLECLDYDSSAEATSSSLASILLILLLTRIATTQLALLLTINIRPSFAPTPCISVYLHSQLVY